MRVSQNIPVVNESIDALLDAPRTYRLDSQQIPIRSVTIDNSLTTLTVQVYNGTSVNGKPWYTVYAGHSVGINITGTSAITLQFLTTKGQTPGGTIPDASIYVCISPDEITEFFQRETSENVTVINDATNPIPVTVTDNIVITPPANQNVTITNVPLPILVTGQTGSPLAVNVNNQPANQPVSVTNVPGVSIVGPSPLPVTDTGIKTITGQVLVTNTSTNPIPTNILGNPSVTVNPVPLPIDGNNPNPLIIQQQAGSIYGNLPAGATLLNSGVVSATWLPTYNNNTGRLVITPGPGVGSGLRIYLTLLQITGFSNNPTVGWALQSQNNAGTYVGQLRGYSDVNLLFPYPYWSQPANQTNQGLSLVAVTWGNIPTGGILVSATVLGWWGAL